MINPSQYTQLISRYEDYFASPPMLDLDLDPITGWTTVRITFEFIPHPEFGNTKLRVRDWYDPNDNHVQYRYCWEVNRKPTGNISAWENEHQHDGIKSGLHHNHHVPYDRKPVQDNYNIRTLEDALAFVISYIKTGKPYP